jgi:hypothetical protein
LELSRAKNDLTGSFVCEHNKSGGKMAKRKVARRRSSRGGKKNKIEFNSWTFFLFVIFVLIAAMITVAQQRGLKLF